MNERRIVFVNRFYTPDISATSQILSDVAESLVSKHYDVEVYTSQMSYDGQSRFPKESLINGVKVHRIWSTRFGRRSTVGRAIDYFSFYISISICLIFALKKADILIAKTDPPMISVPLGVIARLKRAALVNWLQDVFPEVALRLGMGSRDGVVMNILKAIRNRSLKRARTNVAIGYRMAKEVEKLGVPPVQISVVANFADDQAIVPLPRGSPQLRVEWGFKQSDFVVGYSGNLGRAHDLDTILGVAESLKLIPDLKFLFVGGGYLQSLLADRVSNQRLNNIVLKPYQPRERLTDTLNVPNLHWASLNPTLEGFIVPSKLYGIAAAGKPLLMIGDPEGEIGRCIANHGFGKCILPGDSAAASKFILDIKTNDQKALELGRKARQFVDEHASRAHAMTAWSNLIENLM